MKNEIICRLYQGKIYFPNILSLSYMYQSIYRTLIKFQPFTLMKVLFYINQGTEITPLEIYNILNAAFLTLLLHISKHVQTNFTEDIE